MSQQFVGQARVREVVFLFIGGTHQVFHLAPVAAELARLAPDLRVACIVGDAATARVLEGVRAGMDAPGLIVETVRAPLWARGLGRLHGRATPPKLALLVSLHRRLAGCAAIVTPERTSAWLRKFGHARTLMIHFRHGAGDRAPASEARLRAFDIVAVPGEKDVRRAVARGFPEDRLRVCGYVKLDYCTRAGLPAASPFDNGRPTVIYNPHFDPALSSLGVAEAVVAEFRAQSRYNLIFAPHIRAATTMSEAERARWLALAEPGKVVVDLASPALVDMSYTRAADIYLGDVSSQVYEFWVRPRPAVFVNVHRVNWQGDLRYAGWALGEVADDPGQVLPAIDRAVATHPAVHDAQRDAVAHAFGEVRGAARRGAAIVAEALAARQTLK